VKRSEHEGLTGLEDRSSRPHRSPAAISGRVVARVLEARRRERCGPAELARITGVSERTVSRILRRAGMPRLPECDPMTGEVIRASCSTAVRYERAVAGELVHVDVKKLGRIPEGGGWRVNGRGPRPVSRRRLGYDFVHSAVDDHSRFAYSEVLPDELGPTCAKFLLRATEAFAAAGISVITEVMTDNALNYTRSNDFPAALRSLGAEHLLIKAHCPWQNGKVGRLNRTLQVEWAYRRVYRSNTARTKALPAWLRRYNTERPHSALGGQPPVSRLTRT
jgi:transposase InsO family protein